MWVFFLFKEESWKSAQIFPKLKMMISIGLQREMWQILWGFLLKNPLNHVGRP
jgi:hypothetical protein